MRRLARYRRRVGVDADLFADVAAVPPPEASAPLPAHTDPSPDDFGAITLVDWEWATLAPPEWDLSKAAWLMGAQSGPAAAEALQQGYGRTLSPMQLNRWIVYHAAMHLVYEAEQRMSDHGVDAYAETVAGLRQAAELANP